MKKIMTVLLICFGLSTTGFAQAEVKVKQTSSIPQKVRNTFSKHKHHKGYKTKVKSRHHKRVHKHNYKHNSDMIKQE